MFSSVHGAPAWLRRIFIGIAVLCSFALASCGGGDGSSANSNNGNVTASASLLRASMQSLWQQHMEWTYGAIVAYVTNQGDFSAASARLLRNQADLGNSLKPYYGNANGDRFTALLTTHIDDVVAILQAADANDQSTLNAAIAQTYANAQDIADFLAHLNPGWSDADLRAMWKTHIDTTLAYATPILQGQWADAIKNYGVAEAHMIPMGAMLSSGIVAQFPGQFQAS